MAMPTPDPDVDRLAPGFMVVHGNRPEILRDLLVQWLQANPLAPLDVETVLVQSQGMAQWLKLALARAPRQGGLGVAAGFDMCLPAQFMWRMMRCVLGADAVPESSAFDKAPLTWRLWQLLPACIDQPSFGALRRFLAHDPDGSQGYHLASRLADLYDQYQVYRADWLADWAAGRDVQRHLTRGEVPLASEHRWQAELWRAVLADAGPDAQAGSRAALHQRFVEALAQAPAGWHCPGLPARITVFGISSLPAQFIDAMAALSRHCQVLLCVHNPSRHYWGDIVADRDLFRQAYRRHPKRAESLGLPGVVEAGHGHPLLASWGKQGRDYLHMLDQYDEPSAYRERFARLSGSRVDLFEAGDDTTLLGQLQNDILELRPLSESRPMWPPVDPSRDRSVRFHVAYSPQREVEILHDQLLARLEDDPTLQPRDIVVMVPDVTEYAPHVAAVFGQPAGRQGRTLPYSIADRPARGTEPMLMALEQLLRLPEQRCTASEVLSLFDVDAVRSRFGVDESVVARWRGWASDAGVRWGLDGGARERAGLPAADEVNTWRFGLRRMLLGYAAGDGVCWAGVESFADVAGLEAADLGLLAQALDGLTAWADQLSLAASPTVWAERLTRLLAAFFAPETPAEHGLHARLEQRLAQWLVECAVAGFDQPVPLSVAREAWLAGVDDATLEQRFLSGGVNVCTLMPMRAVPFRVVCLLGMNDGAYPRQHVRHDFDLMAGDYRPGDRARREDDRYLLLEALLSAREQLYVSWVGRSARDQAELPPSVLVGQLRDHLAAGWRRAGVLDEHQAGPALLADITQDHPLQPFSRRYFDTEQTEGVDGWYTYARQWRAALDPPSSLPHNAPLAAPDDTACAVPLARLGAFLRQPVDAFFSQRLGVSFRDEDDDAEDDEVFQLGGLERAQTYGRLCEWLAPQVESGWQPAASDAPLHAAVARLGREGRLPLAAFGAGAAAELSATLADHLGRYAGQLRSLAQPGQYDDAALQFRHPTRPELSLEGRLDAPLEGEAGLTVVRLVSHRLHDGASLRLRTILPYWLSHIGGQHVRAGHRTVLVGQTGDVVLPSLAPDHASRLLAQWLDAWLEGMCRPLPVARDAALAWLAAAGPDPDRQAAAAAQVYDGGFHGGEVSASPALLRTYPSFDRLWADGEFAEWAEQLYGDLVRHLRRGGADEESAP